MITRYAFLWHVLSTEDCAASLCESAETEAPTEWEAEDKLKKWFELKQKNCSEDTCECKKGGFLTDNITPKMIMSGMTQDMVKIK